MKYLNEILSVKYPIIQGGMANIANGEFAAACSNAGGLGLIGSGAMNAEALEKEIAICKKLTDKPFGVNLMLMNRHIDDLADLVAKEKISVVTTGAGNPGVYMDKWKEVGMKVIPVSASVTLAKRLVSSGADAIIAEGTEAGGHIGEMTTMTLLPQMVDELEVPVIAAGGIADGRSFAAAMALGAVGVQLGTVLLAAKECPIHADYKEEVLKAKDNSTVVFGRSAKAPVRALKNKMAREYMKKEAQGANREELEIYTIGALKRAVVEGDISMGSLMAGQSVGSIKEIRPVAEIFADIYEGGKKRIANLAMEVEAL